MSVRRTGTTRVEYEAERRELEIRRAVAGDLRRLLEDTGVSQATLARTAHLSSSQVSRLLNTHELPSIHALAALTGALDARLAIHIDPVTGPRIRDRWQARIGEAFLRLAHQRWKRFLEVAVHRPVRGMIDIVLHDPASGDVVATEIHSQIRRFEQQQRWANEKAGALLNGSELPLLETSQCAPRVSRLLVLQSSPATRRLANELETSFRAAYPARSADAYRALISAAEPWPGPAMLWATIRDATVEILSEPPRGVLVGH